MNTTEMKTESVEQKIKTINGVEYDFQNRRDLGIGVWVHYGDHIGYFGTEKEAEEYIMGL